MSMHLEGPWLSTSGKRKGKKKWASAEAKRQAEQLDAEWQALLKRQAAASPAAGSKSKTQSLSKSYKLEIPQGRDTRHIKSLDSGHKGAVTIRQTPKYTGDKIIGVGTMHKSNAVPIFSDQEAKDISSMRR